MPDLYVNQNNFDYLRSKKTKETIPTPLEDLPPEDKLQRRYDANRKPLEGHRAYGEEWQEPEYKPKCYPPGVREELERLIELSKSQTPSVEREP